MVRMTIVLIIMLVAGLADAKGNIVVNELLGNRYISIEHRVNGKFANIVGRLEFDYGYKDSISIVNFLGSKDHCTEENNITVTPDRYIINRVKRINKNVLYIEGDNQYGNVIRGTVDSADQYKTKIMLNNGTNDIVNISDEGKRFKSLCLPNLSLGVD
jgi:hypothetical protein